MSKRNGLFLVGLTLCLTGLIWIAVVAVSFMRYKFDNPTLTETQLQIRAFSMFRWTDLIPCVMLFVGYFFIKRCPE